MQAQFFIGDAYRTAHFMTGKGASDGLATAGALAQRLFAAYTNAREPAVDKHENRIADDDETTSASEPGTGNSPDTDSSSSWDERVKHSAVELTHVLNGQTLKTIEGVRNVTDLLFSDASVPESLWIHS